MLNLKSNKVNVLPVRPPNKRKRDANTVVLTQTTYFKLPLGGLVLVPIAQKSFRVTREKAKQLFKQERKTNWDFFCEEMERHPFDQEA